MKPTKKILYVITQGEWGGAERYIYDLATALGPNFDVIVAIGEPKGRRDLQNKLSKDERIRVIQLSHLVRRITPYHDLRAVFELANLYKKLQPDIIHLNSSKAGIIGSLAKKLLPAPYSLRTVYTIHGWIFNEPLPWLRKKLYFSLEKWTARLKDGFIALSSFEAEQGKTLLKIPSDKITVIPHGVSKQNAPLSKKETRSELANKIGRALSEKTIWVGSIANYHKTKGLDVLIQALAEKKNTLRDVLCLLIGGGPERDQLSKLISENHLENLIYLTGTIAEASRYLPAFDLFVLPSRKEGLPYALLEAMQARVPIIATRVGGIPELIENKKSGLLVSPDSVEELAEALCFSVENPDAMKEYAQNALTPPPLSEMVAQTTSWYRALDPR
ncbi:MAG: glycosyltransferase family 4 protein [Candidatus Magasanikbacteria bacterium]|nr:glycosyltransferase family 4 protein [Candidatus Magasanikbacteria bacterium]